MQTKKIGGLGITNSKLMNVALLTKWWWCLSQNESGLWAQLFCAKYFPNVNPFTAGSSGSTFWNGIQAVRPAFSIGAQFCVNNGTSTRFWLDCWWAQAPLWQSHPELYQLATDTNIMVDDALRVHPPAISFFRPLEEGEAQAWNALVAELEGKRLSQDNDEISWRLTTS